MKRHLRLGVGLATLVALFFLCTPSSVSGGRFGFNVQFYLQRTRGYQAVRQQMNFRQPMMMRQQMAFRRPAMPQRNMMIFRQQNVLRQNNQMMMRQNLQRVNRNVVNWRQQQIMRRPMGCIRPMVGHRANFVPRQPMMMTRWNPQIHRMTMTRRQTFVNTRQTMNIQRGPMVLNRQVMQINRRPMQLNRQQFVNTRRQMQLTRTNYVPYDRYELKMRLNMYYIPDPPNPIRMVTRPPRPNIYLPTLPPNSPRPNFPIVRRPPPQMPRIFVPPMRPQVPLITRPPISPYDPRLALLRPKHRPKTPETPERTYSPSESLLPSMLTSPKEKPEIVSPFETPEIEMPSRRPPLVVQKVLRVNPGERDVVVTMPPPTRSKLTSSTGQPSVLEKALTRATIASTRPTTVQEKILRIQPEDILLPPLFPSGDRPKYVSDVLPEKDEKATADVELLEELARAPELPDAPEAVFGQR